MSEERAQYTAKRPVPEPSYADVRYPDGRLAFRYDPQRGVVELQQRGKRYYFDLTVIQGE